MLNPGIKGHQEITVAEKDLAIHVGSGTVHVLATPMMNCSARARRRSVSRWM